ncbi:MAG: PAS domain S-box protein [Syntrophales bacterium]|nr:PAS domain S-box protein [Syntrophales bacterium]
MKDKPVILIVDDQPQNIELLEVYLVPQGYEIVKAANGEEALGKLSGNQIDLMLLDVMMPGMDGFEVTRRVRQDNAHRLLPIILVTILRETEDRVKGIEAGCDDFISTPVDKMELLARVRSLLKVKDYNELMSNYRKELESELTRRTEELKHAFIFQQRLIDALPVPVFYKDLEGKYLGCNSSFEKYSGQKREQIPGKSVYELSPKEFADIYHEKDRALLQNPGIQIYESIVKDAGGVLHNVIFHKATFSNMDGSVGGLIGAILDITDRKRAEEDLKESENKYRLLADNVNDVIFVLDMNLNYTYVSPSVKILLGYQPEEILKQPTIELMTPSSWELATKTVSEIKELEKFAPGEIPISRTTQLEMRRKDGTTDWVETKASLIIDKNKQYMGILGITRDITDRKQAEEEQKRTNILLKSIIENIPNMIFLKDAKELRFVQFNRAGEDLLGYSRDDLLGKNDYDFFPKEQADFFTEKDRDVLRGQEVVDVPEETIKTRNKGERILHTKKVPILDARGKPEYLLGISEDITERIKVEEDLKETLESLRKAFGATVQVLVSAVETRDPYTSGHQTRSADLARAIATEMGLSQEGIVGIRMAGSIHDIGKMSVPAEILSKPTKLSELEFSIIKEHANKGFEMLKDVESPWPLAEIVYQHHERMDGSGYPRHLKGKEIIMEARILAVADVVESMASHRPYRAALGLNAALAEIENNKGKLYDADAVDACLRLFREKGFQLEKV